MMHRSAMVVSILLLPAAPASADSWRTLDGQKAPEISASEWLNVPDGKTSRGALEGKVWLLTFFGIH